MEEVTIGSGHYRGGWFEGETEEILEQIEEPTNFTAKFPLGTAMKGWEGEREPYLFVEFRRLMTAEMVNRWKSQRKTGIRLSWSYDDPQLETDYKYRKQNRDFIKLANTLNSQNNIRSSFGEKLSSREINTCRTLTRHNTVVGIISLMTN